MKSAKTVSLDSKIQNSKFNFCKHKLVSLLIPSVLIFVGIIILIFAGFNRGIDFTGGTIMDINPVGMDMTQEADFNQAKNKINDVMKEYDVSVSLFQKSENDDGTTISFRFQNIKGLSDDEMETKLNEEIIPALRTEFGLEDSEYINNVSASQRIGATASANLLTNAFVAILVAVVLILIYIAFRFELASGLSAIVALISDVFVTCALVLIFRIQINSSFIAALITIVGYSINNTIIIFDRVRENRKFYADKNLSYDSIADLSIKQSLVRTINTTTTTLIAIVLLAVIGVSSVREFTLPIIFGLIAGTYSSIFVSPNLWSLMYREKKSKNDQNSKQKKINSDQIDLPEKVK